MEIKVHILVLRLFFPNTFKCNVFQIEIICYVTAHSMEVEVEDLILRNVISYLSTYRYFNLPAETFLNKIREVIVSY